MRQSFETMSKIGSLQGGRIPGILLWQASKLWQYRLNMCLADLGLTNTTAAILANVLYFHQEQRTPPSQIDIARSARVDVMTASRAIRLLTRKKLIVRREHKTDSRIKTIQLTSLGKNVAEKAIRRIIKEHEAFFKAPAMSSRWDGFVQELDSLVASNEYIVNKEGTNAKPSQK